jgi:hypothetical protein
MTRNPAIVFMVAILEAGFSLSAASQTSAELKDCFRDSIGLSQGQIADIQNAPLRRPAEMCT